MPILLIFVLILLPFRDVSSSSSTRYTRVRFFFFFSTSMPNAARSAYLHAYNREHADQRKQMDRFHRQWASGRYSVMPPKPDVAGLIHSMGYFTVFDEWWPCTFVYLHQYPRGTTYPLSVTVIFHPRVDRGFTGCSAVIPTTAFVRAIWCLSSKSPSNSSSVVDTQR